MEKVLSTGNHELDSKMGAGLPLGSLVLIEGDNDTGKSVLMQQLIWGGLNQRYRLAIYTTENTVKSLIVQMNSLGLNVTEFFLLGYFRIYPIHQQGIEWSDEFTHRMLKNMIKFSQKIPVSVIGIDSLTVFITHSSENEILTFFTGCKTLCDAGKTILVTAHPYACSQDLFVRIRSICDCHIKMKNKEIGGKIVCVMEVSKIRGAKKTTGNIVSFTVDPNYGLKIIPLAEVRA